MLFLIQKNHTKDNNQRSFSLSHSFHKDEMVKCNIYKIKWDRKSWNVLHFTLNSRRVVTRHSLLFCCLLFSLLVITFFFCDDNDIYFHPHNFFSYEKKTFTTQEVEISYRIRVEKSSRYPRNSFEAFFSCSITLKWSPNEFFMSTQNTWLWSELGL